MDEYAKVWPRAGAYMRPKLQWLTKRRLGSIRKRSCISFSVTGYDTSVAYYDLDRALRKHFASCGRIRQCCISRDPERGYLSSVAWMAIRGEKGTGGKVLDLNGSDFEGCKLVVEASPSQGPNIEFSPEAAASRSARSRLFRSIIVSVSGFDPWLPEHDLESSLRRHFSSCGEVTNISIHRGPSGIIKSPAFIFLLGEDAAEQALELSGSDVGGWKVAVKVLPLPPTINDSINQTRCFGISVTGYDTLLPEDDLKTALSKHFRSCGEVMDISIRRSSAFIYIMGEGAGDKATELSGSDMGGGWKVVAKVDSVPGEYHDEDPPMFIG
ncbi:RNA-binding domain superfamily [Arabidopsis thaliana x Arabidopsis arenosa]|uniref:RNA-binding domain superfamily n=1 Tax=Arabidopsis thaliana x Arabidopsis arenosa TaxID=1240361 RepID=A0A8T1YUK2_9BRAS|nr:RNA-binding domain superfamily [Arabidopsis thaliana x Arabidopsis arenosa]